MKKYEDIAYKFSNGVTVVNTTPHPINFLSPEGEKITIPTSVLEGESTGYAVINATAQEKEVAPHVVDTTFVGNNEGERIISEIKDTFKEDYDNGDLMIVGSMIAANAYSDVKGMCPAPGFERVPPADKLMSCEKFTRGNDNGYKFNKEQAPYRAVDFSQYAEYDDDQITEIREGLIWNAEHPNKQIDISLYANPKYNDIQMDAIRTGLQNGVDVSIYADPKYYGDQMYGIREGLEWNAEHPDKQIDVSLYADPKYDYGQMRGIREGLEWNAEYPEQKIDVLLYADPKFIYSQMKEIRLGLENGIDASLYATPEMTAQEMKDCRNMMESAKEQGISTDDIKEAMETPVEQMQEPVQEQVQNPTPEAVVSETGESIEAEEDDLGIE